MSLDFIAFKIPRVSVRSEPTGRGFRLSVFAGQHPIESPQLHANSSPFVAAPIHFGAGTKGIAFCFNRVQGGFIVLWV
jgi:hypothetical protein